MATVIYNAFKKHLVKAGLNWETASIKVMLAASNYVPNKNTHEFRSDVLFEIPPADGYSIGGTFVDSKIVIQNNLNNSIIVDSADIQFTNMPLASFRYAIFYVSTGLDITDILIMCYDLGSDVATPAGSNFILRTPYGVLIFK